MNGASASVVRRISQKPQWNTPSIPASVPALPWGQEDIRREFGLALARLSEPQRRVFLLRQHSDLKFRKIADITGEPLNNVLSHIRYATTKLRQELQFLREDGRDLE
tara:strand:- start:12147 stop:12467 length:321 start_codon:yes stop_codon:yes gene_type:complete